MRFLPAFLLLLAGCGARTEYHLSFQGPSEDFLALEAAAAEWNACGVVNVSVSIGGDDGSIVEQNDSPICDGVEHSACTYADRLIRYKRVVNLKNLLAHEIGHLVGLRHSERGLMRPNIQYETVGQDECDALRYR